MSEDSQIILINELLLRVQTLEERTEGVGYPTVCNSIQPYRERGESHYDCSLCLCKRPAGHVEAHRCWCQMEWLLGADRGMGD